MKDPFGRSIRRATALIEAHPEASEALRFQIAILEVQQDLAAAADDLDTAMDHFGAFLGRVADAGPAPLARAAENLAGAPQTWRPLLDTWWAADAPLDPTVAFFPKHFLQPIGQRLPASTAPDQATRCPHCRGMAQVGVLHSAGEGAALELICSRCQTAWPFPRIACASCGNTNPHTLGVHTAEAHPHIRLATCTPCRHYLKQVDRTRDGHAIPLVDDLATLALDVWATEQGWSKAEPNLVGL